MLRQRLAYQFMTVFIQMPSTEPRVLETVQIHLILFGV
jgi:hypothetical protein